MKTGLSKAAQAALSRRGLMMGAGALGVAAMLPAHRASAQEAISPYAIGDFFGEAGTRGVVLSPSGNRIAVLEQMGTKDEPKGAIDIIQADAPEGVRRRLDLGPVEVSYVEWANDDRLLVGILIRRETGRRSQAGTNFTSDSVEFVMRRTLSVHAGTGAIVVLFNDQRTRMRNTFDMGRIVDLLPSDPDNIMMAAWEPDGIMALHRVDVNTGRATLIEKGVAGTFQWRTVNGVPVMRHDINLHGTMESIQVRAPGETQWKLARRARFRDAPDFYWVSGTDRPGTVLVAARLESEDVMSVREMDLATLAVGPAMNGRAGKDVLGGLTDSADNYLGAAYFGERLEYEFAEPALAAHHRALNRFFDNQCNVALTDVDAARNRFIARVTAGNEPSSWYFYDKTARAIVNIGQSTALYPDRLGATEILQIPTRDGASVEAYLTAPPGGAPGPLVVLPHGGPEARDEPGWNRQVQVLAAQGWWVLRPNFRGSGGYGMAFAREGWTRWGTRMQEDIEDSVAHVVALKGLDVSKVAIMGTSYGGYAALMSALKRPDLYKAAIGICGVYDLPDMLGWVEREDDLAGKPIYEFWTKRIGDRRTDGPALEAASPRRRAAEITCPVLLVHGVDDTVVPIIQSRRMRDAFRSAGRPVELIEVADFGHADWENDKEQELMTRYIAIFRQAFA